MIIHPANSLQQNALNLHSGEIDSCEFNENELIRATQAGDEDAKAKLIQIHSDLPEDVSRNFVQDQSSYSYTTLELEERGYDALVDVILQGLPGFKIIPGKPLRGYLVGVIRHKILNFLREKKTLKTRSLNSAPKNIKIMIEPAAIAPASVPKDKIQIREDVTSLPPILADVVNNIHGINAELSHGCRETAVRLGLADRASASGAWQVSWMHDCALEQLRSITNPRYTDDEKNRLVQELNSLQIADQQIIYHRYGLANGHPLTCSQMVPLFYSDLSGAKNGAINKRLVQAQKKLSSLTGMSVEDIELVLMSLSGKLSKIKSPEPAQNFQVQSGKPTKLAVFRDSLSLLDHKEIQVYRSTLTPKMRILLAAIIENPSFKAADIARKFQKTDQTLLDAKKDFDQRINYMQKNLDTFLVLKRQGKDIQSPQFSEDLINDIKDLLKGLTTQQMALVLERLTSRQNKALSLFLSDLRDDDSHSESTNHVKHISLRNEKLFSRLKGQFTEQISAVLEKLKRGLVQALESMDEG